MTQARLRIKGTLLGDVGDKVFEGVKQKKSTGIY